MNRQHSKVEGLPGNPKARHTCHRCFHKRYEEDMNATETVKSNNYKSWLLWVCKECKEIKKW